MALHNSLEGFMGELKALPKGSAERGKFVTAHMSHPPFLAAIQKHPQGKQLHSQLMGFLNSPANAGPANGAKVTMKSELTKATDDVKNGAWGHVSNQPQTPTTSEGLEAPHGADWHDFLNSGNLAQKYFVHNDRHLNQIQASKSPDGKISVQYIPHTDDTYAADEHEFAEQYPGKTYIPYEPPTKLGSVNNFAEARQVGDALINHLQGGGAKEDFSHPLLQAQSMPGRHGGTSDAVGKQTLAAPQKLANSERPVAILNSEGDTSVADKETYTIEEAAAILRKDFHEKLVKYSAEIEKLVKREDLSKTAKSVIPSHKHNQAAAASSGTEDIPAGMANPKGTAECGDIKMGKDEVPNALPAEKAEKCMKCGEMHKPMAKCGPMTKGEEDKSHKFHSFGRFGTEEGRVCSHCGEGIMHSNHDPKPAPAKPTAAKPAETKKSDLVDSKGKQSDNHTDPQSADLPDESPAEPAKRDEASGGKLTKKGPKALAKAARKMNKSAGEMFNKPAYTGKAQPPMAKPPSGGAPGASKAPPMSKPAAPPKMPGAPKLGKDESAAMESKEKGLEKAGLGMAAHGQREAAAMGMGAKPVAAAPVKLPGMKAQATRQAGFQDQMADVAAANKPAAAAKPALPKPAATGPAGAKLGLASPKAAGATVGGPVQNAARPVAAKPGIFGKLFGKK